MSFSIPITRGIKLTGLTTGTFYFNVGRGTISVSGPKHKRTVAADEIARLLREEAQQLEATRRDHARRYREFCEFVRRAQAASQHRKD